MNESLGPWLCHPLFKFAESPVVILFIALTQVQWWWYLLYLLEVRLVDISVGILVTGWAPKIFILSCRVAPILYDVFLQTPGLDQRDFK